ncbi:hypothetical protein [Pelagibacterium luteolum]|uniref:Uncharacterized protein n=1 Tax=Pelagibacterium luteolum TaxID=440168 RepID=A0A1G8AT28_9HYPH|nr:hypothetical protein [Pelagibacterium luteolum]SDH23470.1 hypothetical protein SAMN04487974_1382 [Pelagibacterium luteolum]
MSSTTINNFASMGARKFGVDYSESKAFRCDRAKYTPAVSMSYINQVADSAAFASLQMAPGELQFTPADLNFTDPRSRLFFYPWALLSAGQAANTSVAAAKTNWLTQKPRDRRVVIIGDSGGFQIQEGTINFTPSTPGQMLNWLEANTDYSMVLDFPTGGIERGSVGPHLERLVADGHDVYGEADKYGFSPEYMACLIQTELNNQHFQANRTGQTKFLNVIQGRSERESAFWYSRVKHFPFEGWAFAGQHHTHLSMTLFRLIEMHQDGKLADCEWMHFLGISTLKAGMILSRLQKALRSFVAPKLSISFDSSSPFQSSIYATAIVGFERSADRWSFRPVRLGKELLSGGYRTISDYADAWASEDINRVKVSTSIGHGISLNRLFQPQSTKASMNGAQVALLMNHNIQAYIEGFRKAYQNLDDGAVLDRPLALFQIEAMIDEVCDRLATSPRAARTYLAAVKSGVA